jgi:hypothetical protein
LLELPIFGGQPTKYVFLMWYQTKEAAVENISDILRYFENKKKRQLNVGKIPDRRSVTCTACYPILHRSSPEMVEGGHDCDKLHTALLSSEMYFADTAAYIDGCHKACPPSQI